VGVACRGPDKADGFWVQFSKVHNAWTMPFVMSPINSRVVRRSNALMNHRYGQAPLLLPVALFFTRFTYVKVERSS